MKNKLWKNPTTFYGGERIKFFEKFGFQLTGYRLFFNEMDLNAEVLENGQVPSIHLHASQETRTIEGLDIRFDVAGRYVIVRVGDVNSSCGVIVAYLLAPKNLDLSAFGQPANSGFEQNGQIFCLE